VPVFVEECSAVDARTGHHRSDSDSRQGAIAPAAGIPPLGRSYWAVVLATPQVAVGPVVATVRPAGGVSLEAIPSRSAQFGLLIAKVAWIWRGRDRVRRTTW
jgi:hypothetical protein